MSISEHGEYGNKNRCFLKSLFKSEKQKVMMRLYSDEQLPKKIDLREKFKVQIYDQGKTQSCTANALTAAYAIRTCSQNKLNNPLYLSRLFIYYNERKMINQTNRDNGAYIKDGTKSLKDNGSCVEGLYPFDMKNLYCTPPSYCYDEALSHTTNSFEVDSSDYINQFKLALSNGIPIVVGVMVYDSFKSEETAKTGIVKLPNTKSEKLLGGHAICIIGYDDEHKHFIFQNSYSTTWGDKGYGYIPYDYLGDNNLTADCHVLTDVEIKKTKPIPPTPPPSPQPYQPMPQPYQPIPQPFPYQPFPPYQPHYYPPYHPPYHPHYYPPFPYPYPYN